MSKLYVDEIASKTGGTEAMTIDSSGRIKQPTKPVFFAIGQSTGWVSTTGATQIITDWDTSHSTYINQGGMSYSGGRVTVPVAGIYRLTCQVMCQINSGEYFILRPTKNGTVINNAQKYIASGTLQRQDTVSNNILVECSANDVIDISITSASSSVEYYLHTYSNFGIELVS